LNDTSKFTAEADRLARKAEAARSPSEKRMLETHSRFYEALADEPDLAEESEVPRLPEAD
jgi:hypothetical protein